MPKVTVGLKDFQVNLDRFRTELRSGIIAAVVELAETIHTELVLNTPLVTGVARANWQMDLGEGNATFLFGSPRVRPPEHVSPGDFTHNIVGYEPGQTIHIYNNAPYIEKLNEGSSRQAPANFIEAAVATAIGNFNIGVL